MTTTIAPPTTQSPLWLSYSADYFEKASVAKTRLAYELMPPDDANFVRFVREGSAAPKVNVVAVGLGSMRRRGRTTGQLCVKVYVRYKLPLDQIAETFVLPTEYDGIPVDVEQAGLIKTRADYGAYEGAPDPTTKFDPIRPGCSVSGCYCTRGFTGTVGGVLTDGERHYLLGNYHVLGPYCGHRDVYQPGYTDDDRPRCVGKFINGVEPRLGQPNEVDAAVAELAVDWEPEVLYIGGPEERTQALPGTWVHMYSRSSRYSRGYVGDPEAFVKVYSERLDRNVLYTNQVQIVPSEAAEFGDDGDSGGLVLEGSTRRAVGLYFAGGDGFGVANPIYKVLDVIQRVLDVPELTMVYSSR